MTYQAIERTCNNKCDIILILLNKRYIWSLRKCPRLGYLKGLFTNFEYITFFSCPTKRNIFYERFISIKPLWLEIIEKKGAQSQSVYIYNICNSTRSDWLCAPFFQSQSGFIEMDLLQKMFLLVGHEKNVIYSKLVNNPFNESHPMAYGFDESGVINLPRLVQTRRQVNCHCPSIVLLLSSLMWT